MVPSDERICKSKRTKECFRVKRTISKITDSLIMLLTTIEHATFSKFQGFNAKHLMQRLRKIVSLNSEWLFANIVIKGSRTYLQKES